MKPVFPSEAARHRHMAGAHRYGAEVFAASPHEAQRRFAPTLECWSAKQKPEPEKLSVAKKLNNSKWRFDRG